MSMYGQSHTIAIDKLLTLLVILLGLGTVPCIVSLLAAVIPGDLVQAFASPARVFRRCELRRTCWSYWHRYPERVSTQLLFSAVCSFFSLRDFLSEVSAFSECDEWYNKRWCGECDGLGSSVAWPWAYGRVEGSSLRSGMVVG